MGRPPTHAIKMPRAFFGRVILGASMIAFGVEYALAGHPLDGLPPLPWFSPLPGTLSLTMALLLPVLGVALLARFRLRESSFALGVLLMAGAMPHLLHLADVLHDPMERNRFLVPIALGCACFVLCRLTVQTERNYLFLAARALFAFILISFGVNHLLYTGQFATQLPDWVVLHLICVQFTGVCFVAAGIAMLTGYLAQPAALLLSVMFAVWFCVLDIPAIRADKLDANARIHGEVLLALCAAALLMATSPKVPSLQDEVKSQALSRGGR